MENGEYIRLTVTNIGLQVQNMQKSRSSLLIQNPDFGTCVCNSLILDAVAGMNV